MGTFKWPLRISSMDGQQAQDIEATVDTGASFTTLPSSLLRELGIEPTGKRGFLVADGRRVEMEFGQAWATIDGESVVTIVVFGVEDALPCWRPTPWRAWPWRWTRKLNGWFPPT